MSKVATAIGHSNFMTIDQLVNVTKGLEKEVFTQQQKDAMDHGTRLEPAIRTWYMSKTGYTVTEVGLAIPKWDTRLGGSADGLIDFKQDGTPIDKMPNYGIKTGTATEWKPEPAGGMIEIKAPQRMYRPLMEYSAAKLAGKQFEEYYHAHIYNSHYDQMQGLMSIYNRAWCHYVVMSKDGFHFIDMVKINIEYIREVMLPGINEFSDKVNA